MFAIFDMTEGPKIDIALVLGRLFSVLGAQKFNNGRFADLGSSRHPVRF